MADWRATNLRDRADYDAICRAECGEAPSGRCAGCAHWVTHDGFDPLVATPGPTLFKPVSTETWNGVGIGRCDRGIAADAPMEAIAVEGAGAELFTAPSFGCVEFSPAPAGWDHHRLYRWAEHSGGKLELVHDDMAHAEGRI